MFLNISSHLWGKAVVLSGGLERGLMKWQELGKAGLKTKVADAEASSLEDSEDWKRREGKEGGLGVEVSAVPRDLGVSVKLSFGERG